MKPASIKPVRCAIYTRVSTEHGLDQEFNSLDAQYDVASAYIKSQAHAGWALIRSRYDDGGYVRNEEVHESSAWIIEAHHIGKSACGDVGLLSGPNVIPTGFRRLWGISQTGSFLGR